MEYVLSTHRVVLIGIAAAGYAFASLLMKFSAHSGHFSHLWLIMVVLAITALAEIVLLRQTDLSTAYIAILATETILIIGMALYLGEHLSTREILGGLMVLVGTIIVST